MSQNHLKVSVSTFDALYWFPWILITTNHHLCQRLKGCEQWVRDVIYACIKVAIQLQEQFMKIRKIKAENMK